MQRARRQPRGARQPSAVAAGQRLTKPLGEHLIALARLTSSVNRLIIRFIGFRPMGGHLSVGGWHRDDVKALLRRRYGSVAAFEQRCGLPRNSVSDVLRGRTVGRTAVAIVEELNKSDTASNACRGGSG